MVGASFPPQSVSPKNQFSLDSQFVLFAAKYDVEFPTKYAYPKYSASALISGTNKFGGDLLEELPRDMFVTVLDWLNSDFDLGKGVVLPFDSGAALSYLDLTKSVGFPYNSKFGSKAGMFAFDVQKADSCITDYISFVFENALFGNSVQSCFYYSIMKQELTKKWKENDVRQINCGSMTHLLFMVMLFADQNEKFYRSHISSKTPTPSAVGMSFVDGEWKLLYERLRARGERVFAMDVTKFDSCMSKAILEVVCTYRFQHIDKESFETFVRIFNDQMGTDFPYDEAFLKEVIRAMYYDVCNTLLVLRTGDIVFKNHGMPSGVFNTIADNTFALFILFSCYAFSLGLTHEQFKEVWLALQGDDSLVVCADDSWFSGNGLARFAKEFFSWTVTSDHTDARGICSSRLDEAEFLSSLFAFEQHERFGLVCYRKSSRPSKLFTSLFSRLNLKTCDPETDVVAYVLRVFAITYQLYGSEYYDIAFKYCCFVQADFPYLLRLLPTRDMVLASYVRGGSSVYKSLLRGTPLKNLL